MKSKKIVIFLLALLILIVGHFIISNKFLKTQNSKFSIASSPSPLSLSNWLTYKNVYEIKIPKNWINISDSNGHVVFVPGKNGETTGSFTTIVISKNSDSDKPIASEDEFDSWYAKNNEEIPKEVLQKLDNTFLDGEKAVKLIDTSINKKTQNAWSLVTWTRKDGINYYINAQGNKKITKDDFKAYEYLLNSFKFSSD
jgi:hypothetical protein